MIMMLIESALAGSWNYFSENEQFERVVDSVQHLRAADKLPLLDAQYWTLLEVSRARRAQSAEDACSDEIIWTKKDARVESFTR